MSIFERKKTAEWGRELERLAARLRIEPRTPIPKFPETEPALEWLAEADCREAFAERAKGAGAQALESVVGQLMRTESDRGDGTVYLYFPVYAWEVETLKPEDFERVRAEAKERLAERDSAPAEAKPAEKKRRFEAKRLGVILRVAKEEELAEKMLLAGFVVETSLPGARGVGLEPGDLIAGYFRLADILLLYRSFCDDTVNEYTVSGVVERARGAKALRVFRGREVIGLPVE